MSYENTLYYLNNILKYNNIKRKREREIKRDATQLYGIYNIQILNIENSVDMTC